MKKLFILAITCLALITACNNQGNKNIPVSVQKKEKPDTVNIDFNANKDMLIILSILPDSIITSGKWSRTERTKMLESVRAHNYYIDSTLNYNLIRELRNDYIRIQLDKGTFAVSAYQISDGNYIILTNERTEGKQYFFTYQLNRFAGDLLPTEMVLGKYTNYFLKDTTDQTCRNIFDNKDNGLEYDIKDSGRVHITLKNADKNEDCLRGDSLTLRFDPLSSPFKFESIKWK